MELLITYRFLTGSDVSRIKIVSQNYVIYKEERFPSLLISNFSGEFDGFEQL